MAGDIEIPTFRTFEVITDREVTPRIQEAAPQSLHQMLTGPSRWIDLEPEPTDEELMEQIVSGIKENRRRRGEEVDVGISRNNLLRGTL